MHPNQITAWKTQLLEGAAALFGGDRDAVEASIDLKGLHTKIGELTLQNDFLSGALNKAGLLSKAMIDRGHELALATQARLLGDRSLDGREPQPVSATELAVMRRIDELHLNYPHADGDLVLQQQIGERFAGEWAPWMARAPGGTMCLSSAVADDQI